MSVVLTTLLLFGATKAKAADDEGEASWTTGGWQRVNTETHPHLGREFGILQGLGTTSAPPTTAARLESAFLIDAGSATTTLVSLISVRVAVDESRIAYSLRLPLIIGPGAGDFSVASGDLMLERHALTSTPKRRSFQIRTWRLVLPAATADLRLRVLGLENLGGGLDWAQSSFYVSKTWLFHYEATVGFRLDEAMPIRATASSAASMRLMGPLSLFGQLNTALIATPLLDDPLTFALGARLDLGWMEAVVSAQRGLGGSDRRTIIFAVTLPQIRN